MCSSSIFRRSTARPRLASASATSEDVTEPYRASPSPARLTNVSSVPASCPAITFQARAFDLRDVRLLDGPFNTAQKLDEQFLLAFDPDRLLHTFRVNAGIPDTALGSTTPKKSEKGACIKPVPPYNYGQMLGGNQQCWMQTSNNRTVNRKPRVKLESI